MAVCISKVSSSHPSHSFHPVRRSKAADEERSHKARRARDEYRRQSLRAIQKGRVAGLSNLFQGTRLTNDQEVKLNNNSASPLLSRSEASRLVCTGVTLKWSSVELLPLQSTPFQQVLIQLLEIVLLFHYDHEKNV